MKNGMIMDEDGVRPLGWWVALTNDKEDSAVE